MSSKYLTVRITGSTKHMNQEVGMNMYHTINNLVILTSGQHSDSYTHSKLEVIYLGGEDLECALLGDDRVQEVEVQVVVLL